MKHGINKSSKRVVETLVKSVVSIVQTVILYLTKRNTETIQTPVSFEELQDRVACLAVLIRDYPELSSTIVSYELDCSILISANCTACLPDCTGRTTFLRFFIKYMCYLYNFGVSFLLEQLVIRNSTPILVTYGDKTIPLSVYNEIEVFHEIFTIFEETLQDTEHFLKSLYTVCAWSTLSQISLTLLSQPQEVGYDHFRLEIIQILSCLCHKAFHVHGESNLSTEASQSEPLKVVYLFLAQLAEFEDAIRTRLQLSDHGEELKGMLFCTRQLQWMSSILKEKSYLSDLKPEDDPMGLQMPSFFENIKHPSEDIMPKPEYSGRFRQFELRDIKSKFFSQTPVNYLKRYYTMSSGIDI